MKKHNKYDFIIKSGISLKEALYKLYDMVWGSERIPSVWRITTIIQQYKGKGPLDDLNNQRNLHTKTEIPKLFSHMVMNFNLVRNQDTGPRSTCLLYRAVFSCTTHVVRQ